MKPLASLAPLLATRTARRLPPAAWIGIGVGLAVVGVAVAGRKAFTARQAARAVPDYSNRSGLPAPPDAMRGRARADFLSPVQTQVPRSWASDAIAGPALLEKD